MQNESGMIVREWRGRASPANADAYPKHFRTKVAPELRQVEGFIEARLSSRDIGGRIEFLVLTVWRDLDAIRAFAGQHIERAVVEPGAVAALVDFDDRVQHYTVVESLEPGRNDLENRGNRG